MTFVAKQLSSAVQQPNSGLDSLTVEVSGSHTRTHAHTHTHARARAHARTRARAHTHARTTGTTPLKKRSPAAQSATYTTHNKHETRTSMPSAGFEPMIPAIKRFQTQALGRAATGIALNDTTFNQLTNLPIGLLVA